MKIWKRIWLLVVFNRGQGKVGEMRTPHLSNKDDKTVYPLNITVQSLAIGECNKNPLHSILTIFSHALSDTDDNILI